MAEQPDLGPVEVMVNDVRYVREATLFAAMDRVESMQAELVRLHDIRESAWKVVIANQPVLIGTPEDALYHLLCKFDHDFRAPDGEQHG